MGRWRASRGHSRRGRAPPHRGTLALHLHLQLVGVPRQLSYQVNLAGPHLAFNFLLGRAAGYLPRSGAFDITYERTLQMM